VRRLPPLMRTRRRGMPVESARRCLRGVGERGNPSDGAAPSAGVDLLPEVTVSTEVVDERCSLFEAEAFARGMEELVVGRCPLVSGCQEISC
jgi:hypothetical protein